MIEEYDVHYGEAEIQIVESGIEAIQTVLMGNDIHAKERLLFYLDWYMDPYYKQDLSVIGEPLKELLQRVVAKDKEPGVAEEALHLLEAYTDEPYNILESRNDCLEKGMKSTAFGVLDLSPDEVTYTYKGEKYRLSSNIYEPCLFLRRNDELVCTLHNAYTTEQLVEAFTAGRTIRTNYGKDYDKEYDEADFCKVLAAAIESGRNEMDLFYAAQLAKKATRREDQMLSNRVKEYIAENTFCSEYLFKDWESFLDVLYSEGGHVSAILWWDHCKKRSQHLSAGSGGYSDPDDPEYMYAETQVYEDGLETKSLEEIKHHISERRAQGFILSDRYFAFDLVPSFYLDEE